MGHNAIDAEIAACDARSLEATQASAPAFARLLKLAEERDSGQIPRIARFLAASYNGQAFPFDHGAHAGVTVGDERVQVGTAPAQRVQAAQHVVADRDVHGAQFERWGLRWPWQRLKDAPGSQNALDPQAERR